jgi:hypothetical protein
MAPLWLLLLTAYLAVRVSVAALRHAGVPVCAGHKHPIRCRRARRARLAATDAAAADATPEAGAEADSSSSSSSSSEDDEPPRRPGRRGLRERHFHARHCRPMRPLAPPFGCPMDASPFACPMRPGRFGCPMRAGRFGCCGPHRMPRFHGRHACPFARRRRLSRFLTRLAFLACAAYALLRPSDLPADVPARLSDAVCIVGFAAASYAALTLAAAALRLAALLARALRPVAFLVVLVLCTLNVLAPAAFSSNPSHASVPIESSVRHAITAAQSIIVARWHAD